MECGEPEDGMHTDAVSNEIQYTVRLREGWDEESVRDPASGVQSDDRGCGERVFSFFSAARSGKHTAPGATRPDSSQHSRGQGAARARWRERERETEDRGNNKYFSFAGCIYVSVPGDPGEGERELDLVFAFCLFCSSTSSSTSSPPFLPYKKKDEAVRPRPLLIYILRIYKSPLPLSFPTATLRPPPLQSIPHHHHQPRLITSSSNSVSA